MKTMQIVALAGLLAIGLACGYSNPYDHAAATGNDARHYPA